MFRRRLVDTVSKSLKKLEVKTLVQTLTDMLNVIGFKTFPFNQKKSSRRLHYTHWQPAKETWTSRH